MPEYVQSSPPAPQLHIVSCRIVTQGAGRSRRGGSPTYLMCVSYASTFDCLHIPFRAECREPSCPQPRLAHAHLPAHAWRREPRTILCRESRGLRRAVVCLEGRRVPRDGLVGEGRGVELKVLGVPAAILGVLSVAVLCHCDECELDRGAELVGVRLSEGFEGGNEMGAWRGCVAVRADTWSERETSPGLVGLERTSCAGLGNSGLRDSVRARVWKRE